MIAKHPVLKVPVSPADHAQGSADAPVTLVEYGDYECSHCGHAYPIVKRIQHRLGNRLCFVFRNFPLAEIHPHATAAARTAEAAAVFDKFWEMHDMLFEHQDAFESADLLGYAEKLKLDTVKFRDALGDQAIAERVQSDFLGGVRSGVNGTPTFFINGTRFDGDWTSVPEFTATLEAEAVRGPRL